MKVEVEVGIQVPGDFQPGFFQRGKGAAAAQRFGFERAPAGFGLGIIIGVPGRLKPGNAPTWLMRARQAALVYWLPQSAWIMSPGAGWRSTNCFRASSTNSVGICAARCQLTTQREQVSCQVAR